VYDTPQKAELLKPLCATMYKPNYMTSPVDQYKRYNALYHDFTDAYTNVHSLVGDFCPMIKKFVEQTEPELTRHIENISETMGNEGKPYSYHKLVNYMTHFDDFTLTANKLFVDLRGALQQSDDFMTRLIDLKMNLKKTGDDGSYAPFIALMPELNELITALKPIPERAVALETKKKKLESDWQITKEKI